MQKGKDVIFYFSILLFALFTCHNPVQANAYIQSGETIKGNVAEDDVVFYELNNVTDNGSIYAYIVQSDVPVKITLLDERTESFAWRGNTYIDEKKKAGTYYVRVSPNWKKGEASSANFELKVTYPTKQFSHNQSFEPNDIIESAYPVENGKTYKASLEHVDDLDFYQFDHSVDGEYVHLKLIDSSAPIKLELYNEQKQRISYNGENYHAKLKKGKYYVKVRQDLWRDQYRTADYEFEFHYAGDKVSHNQVGEPNDIPYNAFSLANNKKLFTSLHAKNDLDFYVIETTRHGYITAALDSTVPMSVQLFDENMKQFGLNTDRSKINTEAPAGIYYLKVQAQAWGHQYEQGDYSLLTRYPSSGGNKLIKLTIGQKQAIVNGKAMNLPKAPYTTNGHTLVPIRFVSEQLGANVKWNQADKMITISLEGTEIRLYENSKRAFINNKPTLMDTKTIIENGTTVIPLRFVSEQLGANVKWTQKTKQIEISM